MILWEAQGAEERDYNKKDDAGFVGKGQTLFISAGVLSGSRESISGSPHSVTCVCQLAVESYSQTRIITLCVTVSDCLKTDTR